MSFDGFAVLQCRSSEELSCCSVRPGLRDSIARSGIMRSRCAARAIDFSQGRNAGGAAFDGPRFACVLSPLPVPSDGQGGFYSLEAEKGSIMSRVRRDWMIRAVAAMVGL